MSTEPFTDEILSAIIDGEADDATVASVAADPIAAARLAQLRNAVRHVAAPLPDATAERRSASIAAAMAAATPAPQVASLAAARHERTVRPQRPAPQRGRWLAAVAAAIILVVAIPVLANLRSDNDAADTASSSLDASDSTTDDSSSDDGFAADTPDSDESSDAVQDAVDEPANDALDPSEFAGDDAMADEEASADDAADAPLVDPDESDSALDVLNRATRVNSIEVLNDLIEVNGVTPSLTSDQAMAAVIESGLSPECVDSLGIIETPSLALAFLSEDNAEERLLLLSFDDAGNVTTLDAEDCSQLG